MVICDAYLWKIIHAFQTQQLVMWFGDTEHFIKCKIIFVLRSIVIL